MLFNEPKLLKSIYSETRRSLTSRFSALQRAEIAEIGGEQQRNSDDVLVSVLFNEPKLLKYKRVEPDREQRERFSALQRAEIAEIPRHLCQRLQHPRFQCSSTSRNC